MNEETQVNQNQNDRTVHPLPPTPIDTEKKPRLSDLTRRVLTAAVLIPSVLYVIYLGGLWYLGTVIVIILLGLREFYGMIEDKGAHPLVTFGSIAAAALPVVAYVGNEYHATILMTFVLLVVMVLQLGKAQITEALESISGTFFGVFYVGWLLTHAIVLRNFSRVVESKWGADSVASLSLSEQAGIFYMVFVLTCVVACDAGAYAAGRAWGSRKLAPKVSPGKTVEGVAGGVVCGIIAGLLCKWIFDLFWPALSHGFGWWMAGITGFVLSLVGVIGDLIESLLKRDAKRKDAGSLLPGMGGVLDRIDSSQLGIPVMYYLLLAHTYLRVV